MPNLDLCQGPCSLSRGWATALSRAQSGQLHGGTARLTAQQDTMSRCPDRRSLNCPLLRRCVLPLRQAASKHLPFRCAFACCLNPMDSQTHRSTTKGRTVVPVFAVGRGRQELTPTLSPTLRACSRSCSSLNDRMGERTLKCPLAWRVGGCQLWFQGLSDMSTFPVNAFCLECSFCHIVERQGLSSKEVCEFVG